MRLSLPRSLVRRFLPRRNGEHEAYLTSITHVQRALVGFYRFLEYLGCSFLLATPTDSFVATTALASALGPFNSGLAFQYCHSRFRHWDGIIFLKVRLGHQFMGSPSFLLLDHALQQYPLLGY